MSAITNLRRLLWALACLCAVAAQAQMLILFGSGGGRLNYAQDVQTKLIATGLLPGTVTIYDAGATAAPSLAYLQQFQAVLAFTDSGGYQSPSLVGDVLADYVDGGGGVVEAVFANGSIPLTGRWESGAYTAFNSGGQTQGTPLSLGTIHDPHSPIMQGITTFTDTSSYRSTGSLRPGVIRVADWSNGDPLVVQNPGFAGRIVSLNFYPPSSTVSADFWNASTDGAKLMANSLNFVAIPEPSTWAMLVLGTGLLGLAARRRRA